ncbi:MAG: glycosyltransferase family 2 protein [Lachnospiraceae bacterium]|nr:glycosyltransferase family 2 protein [Lachnospiraceae bacterium]
MSELISIVIPVHNAGQVLNETIASVKSQTYGEWELILVDDGSSDNSVETAETAAMGDDRIRLIRNTGSHGASYARNAGVLDSKGRYLCFLDADDLWLPKKLEEQLGYMKSRDAAFSFTGYEFADEKGCGLGKTVRVPETISYREALKNTTIFTSTVMFDLGRLKKSDIEMPHIESEDTALWWRLLRNGVTGYGLDISLTLYRRSPGTLSSNKITAIKRIWRLYREAEGLSVPYSAYCFCFWAARAVLRRI